MIYRRDVRNRSLDDFSESRQRTGPRAARRAERTQRVEAPAPPAGQPALASAAVK